MEILNKNPGLSAEQANQQAQNNLNNANLEQARINTGVATGNRAADQAYTSGIMSTLGTLGAAGAGMATGGASLAVPAAAGAGGLPAGATSGDSYLLPANPDMGYAQPTAGQQAGMDFGGSMNPTGRPAYNYNQQPLITSDARAKKDIKEGGKDMQTFLNEVAPYNYVYKDPQNGVGPQTGVMAQDLEKSQVGKQMVVDASRHRASQRTS